MYIYIYIYIYVYIYRVPLTLPRKLDDRHLHMYGVSPAAVGTKRAPQRLGLTRWSSRRLHALSCLFPKLDM